MINTNIIVSRQLGKTQFITELLKNMSKERKDIPTEYMSNQVFTKDESLKEFERLSKLNGINTEVEKEEIRRFATGAVRDSDKGKEDYVEGISWLALQRYARYMDSKSLRYGRGNWIRGLTSECLIASMLRHVQKFMAEWQYGICDEKDDHLSAVAFNLLTLMHELELHKHGKGRCNISEEYKKLYPNQDSENTNS